MKKLLIPLSCALALGSVAGEPIVESNFRETGSWPGVWQQTASGYYQPLGKVTPSPDGLRLEANPQTPVMVTQKEKFTAKPGDIVEVTTAIRSEKPTYVYLSVFESFPRGWVKNDTVEFRTKEGVHTYAKQITLRAAPGKTFSLGALSFGVAKGGNVVFESIQAVFKGIDAQAVVRELPAGLTAHFDASRPASLVRKDGRIVLWRDLSSSGNDARERKEGSGAVFLPDGLNHLSMARFSGKQEFITQKPLQLKEISAFVVFRREASQKSEGWQHQLYWDDGKRAAPATHTLTGGANGGEETPRILHASSEGDFIHPLIIGSNGGLRGYVTGDIGEILIFNRKDFTAKEIETIRSYLLAKWKIDEDDYVRVGPLPETPKRITDDLPLSDQGNRGKWRLVKEFSDEFNGTALDRTRWMDTRHYTIGSAPARCLPENVVVKDGMAQIITRYDPNMPSGRVEPRGPEYHSFSVGRIFSRNPFRYGYLEIRAKIQATSFNNAFWLYGVGENKKTGEVTCPEIDIFELAGKSFAHTYTYNMALHNVIRKPYKHSVFARNWKSDFKFSDDFHVYGLEWTPKVIRYFIDGSLVREFKVKNNLWDMPMRVHFDSIPHFDWFGVPDPKDFPCAFQIDYFRLWKNPETDLPEDDWKEKYKYTYLTPDTGFAFDYYKKYGDKIVLTRPMPQNIETKSLALVNVPEMSKAWKSGFGAVISWDAQEKAMSFLFPAAVTRKDNGEVQYAAPGAQWPYAEIQDLPVRDWKGYRYLAIEFVNPGFLQAFMLTVTPEKGTPLVVRPIMKSGKGVLYIPLPESVQSSPVKCILLRTRGSDRIQSFRLTDLKLEK